ncbi:MAG: 3-hydroxyacyl-CoA dehydrogenase NAD-binding domain-containing protein [Bacteroidota bacterium]
MISSIDEIKSIGIVGAGTMGLGIAQICALNGFKTWLFDIDQPMLEKAKAQIVKNLDIGIEKGKLDQSGKELTLSNLSLTDSLSALEVDFVIEAIVEKLDVKQKVFQELETFNDQKCILASNTSSIPITQIAAKLKHPERFVGMHFFNPAHIMKLVEVISGASTSAKTSEVTLKLAQKLGKIGVSAKDSPGFIVNRVARHFYVESLLALEENVADIESIDKLMKSSGFRMGPFELMDLIGVDTNFSVTTSMFEAFHKDGKFRPSRIQQQKVDAGHHGRKSGKGFYDYS